MSKKKQESDLGIQFAIKGISLKGIVTILQTGKKLTRGAKHQLINSALEKENGEKHSQMSFDSKKSIETKRDVKKNDKNIKKKQGSSKSLRLSINEYLGIPDLETYITSENLQLKCHYRLQKFSISQLSKNHFPNLLRVILKNNLSKQPYQIKRGQLKKQKTTRDQFLIDLSQSSSGRSDVRSITKDNGIVMIGQNLAMIKLNFDDWSKLFQQQIEELIKQIEKNCQQCNSQKISQEKQQIQKIQEEKIIEQNYHSQSHISNYGINSLPCQKQKNFDDCFIKDQISFVQIQPNESNQSYSKDSELLQYPKQNSLSQIKQKQQRKKQIQNEKINLYEIFNKFCIPGYDYILWPIMIYETILGEPSATAQIIQNKQYLFCERDKTNLFETIAKLETGLFQTQQSTSSYENNPQIKNFINDFSKKIAPKLQRIIAQEVRSDQSQINLTLYTFGSGKLLYFSSFQQITQKIIPWNIFTQQFLNFYFLNSNFKQISEEICQSIDKLNDFSKLQITECKLDEIRNSIDRLVKCSINDKIYIGITLRYSNIQKKILVLLFGNYINTQNQLIWLNIEQIYPNYTLPQLNLKNKFLLYFSNALNSQVQISLGSFLMDVYASYFYKPNDHLFTQNYYLKFSKFSQSLQNLNQNILSRCVECYYPIHRLQFYKCCFCDNFSHKQCSTKIINKSLELNLQGIQTLWTCNVCEPCTLCLQPLGNKRISCMKCKNMFHQICGKLKVQQNTIHRDKYLCENCIQCKICEKKLKNLDYVLMKGGYQCVNCYKAEQANEICHICKKQGDGGKWAQCSRQFCGKWIHKNCDKYIQSRNHFFSNNNEEVYFCPFCRKVQKRRIIIKFIEILTVFDEYQYFIGSDYEDILDYKYVIGNPMCFRKMYERCLEGGYDQNTKQNLEKDFNLVISNALKYNMPKDQPHYQARILNILGHHAIQKFQQQIECTEEQLIQGNLTIRLNQKRRELYRQIYDRYLEIILNYKSKNSVIEVRKPKQTAKGQKLSQLQLSQIEPFVFSSRHLLKDVFRSSMLKFKIKRKSSTIENLFDIQKVIEAYKCPIKENFCFYHYWNSNVVFYCEICMEHYCCAKKCYKHNICSVCGIKGCACDVNECGCPPLKQKQKKIYQKIIHERYYDRRQITQNFTLCLRCACEKLSTKVCCYCEKSYEFFYDFQACLSCDRIYHKECGDVHASENLSKFFFKKQKTFPNQQLFSNTLRLDKTCYQCSISRSNKPLMFEKLKSQSLSKLMKLQKLCKFQLLIASIYHENGIKLSLNDILNLILNNYDDFLEHQFLFEEYRLNMPSIRLNTKLYKKVEQRTDWMVKNKFLDKSSFKRQENDHSKLQLKKMSILELIINYSINCDHLVSLNVIQIWNEKLYQKASEFILKKQVFYTEKFQNYFKKIKTEKLLQRYEKSKASLKTKKICDMSQQINIVSILTVPTSKKNINLTASSTQKLPIWNKSHLQNTNGYQKAIGSKNSLEKQEKNSYSKLLTIFYDEDCFKTFIELQICSVQQLHQQMKNNYQFSRKCERSFLSFRNFDFLIASNLFSKINPLIYEKSTQFELQTTIDQELKLDKQNQHKLEKYQDSNHLMIEKMNFQNILHSQKMQIDIDAQLESAFQNIYKSTSTQCQNQVNASLLSIQQELTKLHCSHTNLSKISKFKRLTTIHKIISKFLLRCFEFNKNAYRRGNTCILKAQPGNWRILKKGKQKNQFYEISLKKQDCKWYFSINENTWWINSIQQIISKLQPLTELSNFRELADFLGFTFKFIPIEKAAHFTRFLQTNSLQDLNIKQKKQVVLQLYDKFEWMKNGICKNKITEFGKEQLKDYMTTKKKIFYLFKRKSSALQQIQQQKITSIPPYITYEDLKKDLEDTATDKKQQPISLSEPGDKVFIGPSPIHKLGLFAKDHYQKHTTMVEYIGQVVSQSMADVRQSRFHFGCYMFGLNRRNCDKRQIIDATFKGNMARYLNHSCDPNCKAKIQVVNNQPSIFIYSIRDINQFEQLTYDYQFSVDANEKLVCTCGAKNCQGRLN